MEAIKKSINMMSGFLYRRENGIFKDNTNDNDYADDEDNRNATNSNIASTDQQAKSKKINKHIRKKNKQPSTTNSAMKYQNNKKKKQKNVRLIEPKYCNSKKDKTNDEADETVDEMSGLQGRYRSDSSSDNDNPKSTKTKQNPTSINRGAAAAFNQKTRNKSMYNEKEDNENDDIVIVKDINDEGEEENDEPDNRDYGKQGIFETNNSNNQITRNLPNNINNDGEEVKLPNEIKALSGRKFKGNKLNTY